MPAASSRRSPIAACACSSASSTQLPRARAVSEPALLRELQADDRADELLLGAVVEVAPEPPALLVARLEDARPRGGELLARVGVGERVGDQLGERGDALLGVGRGGGRAARRRR